MPGSKSRTMFEMEMIRTKPTSQSVLIYSHQYAVVKLDGSGVLEDVPDSRREGEEIIREPVLAHFWKGVVH